MQGKARSLWRICRGRGGVGRAEPSSGCHFFSLRCPGGPRAATCSSQRSELLRGWVQLVQPFPERGFLVRNRLVNGSNAHLLS